MNEIVFVTGNKGKVASAKKHLGDEIKIINIDLDTQEPNVNDIDYIAEYKVKTAFEKVKKPCLALDAGFYIPAFPGNPNFPGAFPKRELINKMGISGCLEKMKGVTDRECYFKECLAYFDGRELKKFYGYVRGTLSEEVRGTDTDKKWSDLWYIFIPNNCSKTMAEMTDEERANRNDGYVNPFELFGQWFKSRNLEDNSCK